MKTENIFKKFAEIAANAFGNVDFITAYPTAGPFGDNSDNSITVELWSEEAKEMIDRRDFNSSGWNFGWNSSKGRITSFNFDGNEQCSKFFTDLDVRPFDCTDFIQETTSNNDKVHSFREFAKKLVNCFKGARYVTAYPVDGSFAEDGMPNRVRFDVWNSDAESTINCKVFSVYDGWAFTPGRITSFDLTASPDGSGRNPEFFSEFGKNLSDVDWSEVVVAV